MFTTRSVCWFVGRGLLSLLGLLVIAGCSSTRPDVIHRDGPPFDMAFPDPSVLLTTTDVPQTRKLLASVQLPRDEASLEELVALTEAAPALDTEHILLLTEAVPAQWGDAVALSLMDPTWRARQFAEGDTHDELYARVSDQLLESGMARWSNPDARGMGRLMGRARTDAALIRIAEQWLPDWDDGSVGALEDILGGMSSSRRLDVLVLQVLIPQRRLEGERQWLAVDALVFDSERVAVLLALMAQRTEVSVAYLLECLQRVTFDSDRMAIIREAQPKLGPCSSRDLRDLMSTLSFDSDRAHLLELFADQVTFEDARDVARTLRLFSFASDREKGLRLLATTPGFTVRSGELLELMSLVDFDSDREDILRIASPRLDGPLKASDLRSILRRFDFGSDRLDVLRLLAGHLATRTPAETDRIVNLFTDPGRRATAREILGSS